MYPPTGTVPYYPGADGSMVPGTPPTSPSFAARQLAFTAEERQDKGCIPDDDAVQRAVDHAGCTGCLGRAPRSPWDQALNQGYTNVNVDMGGGYVPDPQWRYEAPGGGYYPQPGGRGPSFWIAALFCLLALLVLAFMVPQSGSEEEDFDCDKEFLTWQRSWSAAKQEHCCETRQRGCPQATTTSSLPYDCNADFEQWDSAWSESKKKWCCETYRKGCGTTPEPPTRTHDCAYFFENWRAGWSLPKKDYCCENESKGCQPGVQGYTPVVTEPRYDCDQGLQSWRHGWSNDKKKWCCWHSGNGCLTLSEALAHY